MLCYFSNGVPCKWIIIFYKSSSEWLLCNTFPWLNPDSPLLVEEVAKSTSSLVPSVVEVCSKWISPMLFLALRLQAVTHASFKVPSVPTAQDVSARKQFKMAPSSSNARLLFSLWPVATATIVQHLQKDKRASWQCVTASCHQRFYGH